jgi:hypothetical protein
MTKEYGNLRLALLSIIFMVTYFTLFYLMFSTFQRNESFVEFGLFSFIFALFFIVPIHKLLHILPLWLTKKKVKIKFTKINFVPMITFSVEENVPRNITIFSVIFPFLLITILSLNGAIYFPQFLHYFAIFSAIHAGLCMTDLLYLIQLIKAPKHSYIDNNETGLDILIEKN